MSSTAATTLEELRAQLAGRLATPADADYEELRAVFYGGNLRPAAVARVANAEDIAAVIGFARATGTELAVRGGGHSGAGHSTTDGGIVIDMRDLKRIEVDPEARTAWAEAGNTAAEVNAEVAKHGLVIGFGDTGTVGIAGITLGGGVGYLVRKFGLTIDNLEAVELVTANGELLTADATHHPDLFWALRGGGGNFGVVTRLKYRLHELPQITGGMLVQPATAETVAAFMAAAEAAPEELSAIVNVMPCPPLPFVAEEHHGSLVIFALLCFAGEADAGEAAMAPFRAVAEPLGDLVRPMTYPELFPAEEAPPVEQPADPSMVPGYAALTLFTDRIGPDESSLIVERLGWSDSPMRVAQLRVLGGAMARVAPEATAFAHRQGHVMVNVAAMYVGPTDRVVKEAWVQDLATALRRGDRGAYVNFVNDEGPDRVRDAYPGDTWDRLAAVKARYDPENLFHRNHNIPPAA
ncbi:MAG TPA: FAD-binding oxidoreductase [Patescibacteria group bacterium]|nr:FAD-binding oxidoreductase [Patescibacteria group bacterium]